VTTNRFKVFIYLVTVPFIVGCNSSVASTVTPAIVPPLLPSPTQSSPSPTPITPTPTQFATNTPLPSDHDGLIAFYSDRDGNPEIYAMNPNGGELKRLTNDPGFDDSPAISPDGTKIIFLTARHDPNPQFPDLKYEIYSMDADGRNMRRLTHTQAAEDHPAWSPDGTSIIFDADYDSDGFAEIYTMNPDGSAVTRLTFNTANDQFADWSPDGKQITFSSDRAGNWDIYTMDVDGRDQKPLTSSPDWELFPAWSPDGSQIAFNGLGPNSRNTDVYVMDVDGSNIRQLTQSPGFDESPAWSPNGSLIAFQTQRDGNFEIYVMNPDGSDQRALATNPANELWPSWGPAAKFPVNAATPLLFEQSGQELGMRETVQAALGDLDQDGDLDAVFANPMRSNSAVWLNDGFGEFVNTGQQLTQYGHGVGLADFDQDGDLDAFIVCHQFYAGSKVYLNDGTGMFSDSGQDLNDTQLSAAEVNLIDLNGDDYMDVHVAYYDPSGLPDQVYLNDGKAMFRDSGLALEEDGIAWGDLDMDGDVDYFGKRWGVGYVVQLNDGTGAFYEGWHMTDEDATVGGIALADFDNDGDLDALVTNGHRSTGSFPSRLLLNSGDGQFTDSQQHLNDTQGAELAVGDLDLDGDLDAFITNMDRSNEVWLNDHGRFTDSGLRLGIINDLSGRPSLGDLDGDGDLDAIVGRFQGGAEIWFNTTLSDATVHNGKAIPGELMPF
jgi:Tol biopolymer transport system component